MLQGYCTVHTLNISSISTWLYRQFDFYIWSFCFAELLAECQLIACAVMCQNTYCNLKRTGQIKVQALQLHLGYNSHWPGTCSSSSIPKVWFHLGYFGGSEFLIICFYAAKQRGLYYFQPSIFVLINITSGKDRLWAKFKVNCIMKIYMVASSQHYSGAIKSLTAVIKSNRIEISCHSIESKPGSHLFIRYSSAESTFIFSQI